MRRSTAFNMNFNFNFTDDIKSIFSILINIWYDNMRAAELAATVPFRPFSMHLPCVRYLFIWLCCPKFESELLPFQHVVCVEWYMWCSWRGTRTHSTNGITEKLLPCRKIGISENEYFADNSHRAFHVWLCGNANQWAWKKKPDKILIQCAYSH